MQVGGRAAPFTAFATRAPCQLSQAMEAAGVRARREGRDAFRAVGLDYVELAVDKPAFSRAMWHEEAVCSSDPDHVAAASRLIAHR